MKKIKMEIGPTKILLLALLTVIVIGALILSLPICNNEPIKMLDALFVSTSAVCVTGLTTIVPIEQFNIIGQAVLLVLIQVGGIGFMTMISIVLILIGKKLNLSDKIIIRESLNQDSFKGLVRLVKKIFIYTIIIEAIGAFILSTKFIPDFGIKKGIWFSIFHSISAFCNAGFDLLGRNSIMPYASDRVVCLTLMLLIIIGGLGFTVWDDIIENIKNKRKFHNLSLHTKIVLIMTLVLLVSGTFFTFMLEHDNIHTMGQDLFRNQNVEISVSVNNIKNSRIFFNATK